MFASVWAWIQANPALVLAAWPIITGLVNLIFGAAEKYAESAPKFHAVLSLIESAGFDARGTLAALAKLLPSQPAEGAKKLLMLLMFGALASQTTACISSAPIW